MAINVTETQTNRLRDIKAEVGELLAVAEAQELAALSLIVQCWAVLNVVRGA